MARKSLLRGLSATLSVAMPAVFVWGAIVSSSVWAAESSLETWIGMQTDHSLSYVYDAISPADGAPGSVMASPSRDRPNYYFHWVRDSALVMREVWNYRAKNPTLAKQTLEDFAMFSRKLQMTDNYSGPADGMGLGEPKFAIGGAACCKDWFRPQNDGPALRVLALLGLADDLMLSGGQDFVYKYLYTPEMPARTVIKGDLEFVAHHWQDSSVDLWEEVKGDHFYTRIAQWRALNEGALFAKRMGDDTAAAFYAQQATAVQDSLNAFWSGSKGYLLTTLNPVAGHMEKTSNLDVAVLLGVLHSGKSGSPFYVDDDRVISTVNELINAFDYAYSVNRDKMNNESLPMGPGLGRYTEDKYDGYVSNDHSQGNPWFLATHAAAEFMLRLRGEIKAAGSVKITDISRPFFESLVRKDFSGMRKLQEGDPTFLEVLQALQDRSDAFIRRSKYHTGDSGRQSEQFNRVNGFMQGAHDLTWSYASFLSLSRIRGQNYD